MNITIWSSASPEEVGRKLRSRADGFIINGNFAESVNVSVKSALVLAVQDVTVA